MNGESRSTSAQDIEFLTKVAAYWKTKDSELGGDKQFGRFVIQRCLGQGGFGIVYLAFDPLVGRDVAIKVPGVQSLFDESRIRRFLAEAQHLGALAHPNIAQVYEASEVDGLCYIAMKYYPEGSLADWIRSQSKPIPICVVLDIFKQIVDGVATAHSAGLIHRDLKPSNILLESSSRDSSQCHAKVIPCIADFGLAKNLVDSHLSWQTAESTRIGTMGYVAPEQWHNTSLVSPAADVYSLGAIFLEMLTTGIAIDRETTHADFRNSIQARSNIPIDIVQICNRCLLDNPKERYANADELKRQIEKVSIDSVMADVSANTLPFQSSSKYETILRITSARIKALGAVCLIGLGAIGIISWSESEGGKPEFMPLDEPISSSTSISTDRLNRDYALGVRSIFDCISSDSTTQRNKSLAQVQSYLTDHKHLPFEVKYLRNLQHQSRMVQVGFGNTHLVLGLLQCPTQPIVAMHGPRNDIVLFDLEENRLLRRLEGLSTQQRRFAFSPDGQSLVGSSLSPGKFHSVLEVLVWDVGSGRLLAVLDTVVNASYLLSLQFLNSDQLLLAGHFEDGHRLKVVSVSEKRVLGNHAMEEVRYAENGQENMILLDETREYRLFRLLEKDTQKPVLAYLDKATNTSSSRVASNHLNAFCAANGELVAYVDSSLELHSIRNPDTNRIDQKLVVWDPKQDTTIFEKVLEDSVPITAITLSQDCESVLSIDANGLLRMDRMIEMPGKQIIPIQCPNEVWGVDYHPERNQMLSAIDGGTVALHLEEPKPPKLLSLHGTQLVTTVKWRPQNAEQFASAGFDKAARVWELTGNEPKLMMDYIHPNKVRCLAFSPNGDLLATGCDDNRIRIWDLNGNACVATLEAHHDKIRCLTFSADGTQLMSGANDRKIMQWSATDFQRLTSEPVPSNPLCCAIGPSGDLFVFGTEAGMLCIRSWTDPSFRKDLVVSSEPVRSVAVSKDGRTIVTGSQDGAIGIWNLETGIKLGDLAKEQSAILSLSFSKDNEALSAGLYSGQVVIWPTKNIQQ